MIYLFYCFDMLLRNSFWSNSIKFLHLGCKIFWPDNNQLDLDKDPFRLELNNKRGFGNIGAPPKPLTFS